MSVTTDGVHRKCTENEWKKFLIYCLLEDELGSRRFGNLLKQFLFENISDNFSSAIMLRKNIQCSNSLLNILNQGDISESQRS